MASSLMKASWHFRSSFSSYKETTKAKNRFVFLDPLRICLYFDFLGTCSSSKCFSSSFRSGYTSVTLCCCSHTSHLVSIRNYSSDSPQSGFAGPFSQLCVRLYFLFFSARAASETVITSSAAAHIFLSDSSDVIGIIENRWPRGGGYHFKSYFKEITLPSVV